MSAPDVHLRIAPAAPVRTRGAAAAARGLATAIAASAVAAAAGLGLAAPHAAVRETTAQATGARAGATSEGAAPAIALPVRHASRLPVPGEPPPLPAGLDTLTPVTLTVVTRWEQPGRPPRTSRQTVLRTVDRVLVATEGQRSEWLFERNPIDGRRVSGFLVDHGTQRILVHQESDLRTGQQLRGWADVLTIRFDPAHLQSLRATGERQIVSGETFLRYVSRDSHSSKPGPAVLDVWWSERRLLPQRVTTREGPIVMTSTIESLEEGVDTSRLMPPASRFPAYRVMDITDAREAGRH